MEWQPIETFPYDQKTYLLANRGEVVAGSFHLGHLAFPWVYVDDWKPNVTGCCDHESDDLVCTNGWRFHDSPTHWMPLPEPPK